MERRGGGKERFVILFRHPFLSGRLFQGQAWISQYYDVMKHLTYQKAAVAS